MLGPKVGPISWKVGADRGTPIDRVFIEAFLELNRSIVRGNVLEIRGRDYTKRFGGAAVTRSDVLDVNRDNREANIFDDIRSLSSIPSGTYDCVIVTQVLQYVDDLDGAIRAIHRVLAPGGSVIITAPTLGKLDGQEDKVAGHYWRLTPDSARYLLERRFPADHVDVQAWGNVRLAMGFLSGLCAQDMTTRELSTYDPSFTCGVLIRATTPR
jgi:SAM-dependent methyltransferase